MTRAFLISQGHKPEDLDAWSYEEQYCQVKLFNDGITGNLPLYLHAWIQSGSKKFSSIFNTANQYYKIDNPKQKTEMFLESIQSKYRKI